METNNEFDDVELDPLVEEIVPQDSRYYQDAITVDYEGSKMYDIPQIVNISPSEEDTDIVISQQYVSRLDKVAYDFYENSKYWWIVADRNKVISPFDSMYKKMISIPSLNNILLSGVI